MFADFSHILWMKLKLIACQQSAVSKDFLHSSSQYQVFPEENFCGIHYFNLCIKYKT